MTDVATNFKPLVVCECSDPDCGEGVPRAKRHRDGTLHTRTCTCRACTSGQHAKNEKRRVGKCAKRTGLRQASASGRKIGYDLAGCVAVEETSDQALVGPLRKWWARVDVQRKVKRVRAQRLTPWAFAASWDGAVRLVVTDAESFAALCLAAAGSDMEVAAALIAEMLVEFPEARTSAEAPVVEPRIP